KVASAVHGVVTEDLREAGRLISTAAIAPTLLERHDIRVAVLQGPDQRWLPALPRAEAAPDVPGQHTKRGRDHILGTAAGPLQAHVYAPALCARRPVSRQITSAATRAARARLVSPQRSHRSASVSWQRATSGRMPRASARSSASMHAENARR